MQYDKIRSMKKKLSKSDDKGITDEAGAPIYGKPEKSLLRVIWLVPSSLMHANLISTTWFHAD